MYKPHRPSSAGQSASASARRSRNRFTVAANANSQDIESHRVYSREDLIVLLMQAKKQVTALEAERCVLKADNRKAEAEHFKQEQAITQAFDNKYTSTCAIWELRRDIEKSVMVRQLKTQLLQVRELLMAKENAMELLKASLTASRVAELTVEKEEYYLEVERLRMLLLPQLVRRKYELVVPSLCEELGSSACSTSTSLPPALVDGHDVCTAIPCDCNEVKVDGQDNPPGFNQEVYQPVNGIECNSLGQIVEVEQVAIDVNSDVVTQTNAADDRKPSRRLRLSTHDVGTMVPGYSDVGTVVAGYSDSTLPSIQNSTMDQQPCTYHQEQQSHHTGNEKAAIQVAASIPDTANGHKVLGYQANVSSHEAKQDIDDEFHAYLEGLRLDDDCSVGDSSNNNIAMNNTTVVPAAESEYGTILPTYTGCYAQHSAKSNVHLNSTSGPNAAHQRGECEGVSVHPGGGLGSVTSVEVLASASHKCVEVLTSHGSTLNSSDVIEGISTVVGVQGEAVARAVLLLDQHEHDDQCDDEVDSVRKYKHMSAVPSCIDVSEGDSTSDASVGVGGDVVRDDNHVSYVDDVFDT